MDTYTADAEAVKQFIKRAGIVDRAQVEKILSQTYGLRQRSHREKIIKNEKPERIEKQENKLASLSSQTKTAKTKLTREKFSSKYIQFRREKEGLSWEMKNMDLLFEVFQMIAEERKGYLEVISNGELGEVLASLRLRRPDISLAEVEELERIYLVHLLQFEYYWQEQQKPLSLNKGISLTDSLGIATFIGDDCRQVFTDLKAQQGILQKDIVVIERAAQYLDLEDVTLDLMKKEHGNQLVDLRIQNPMDYGFNYTRLMNKEDKMTIAEYCEYQQIYDNQTALKEKYGDKLKGGKIMFAVNFEPATSGHLLNSLKEKLDLTMFGWAGSRDVLSYLEQHINGCTNPQFYLKVKGCWTGGHQENVSMCAININLGPAASQWFAVPVEETERLRVALKEKFKLDLYEHQGLWYQKVNWFIDNGYKIKRIIQKPGDMVVSGPGTLHWVRCFGVALQAAWNIFTDSHKSWVYAYHRQVQNKKIRFRKSNTIPLKTLTLKHLDHKSNEMSDKTRALLFSHLDQWRREEENVLNQIEANRTIANITIEPRLLEEHQSFCETCLQQILVYYTENTETNKIFCMECTLANILRHPVPRLPIYHKLDPVKLDKFLEDVRNKRLEPGATQYCSGEHIGFNCAQEREQKIAEGHKQEPTEIKIGEHVIKISLEEGSQTEESFMHLKRPFPPGEKERDSGRKIRNYGNRFCDREQGEVIPEEQKDYSNDRPETKSRRKEDDQDSGNYKDYRDDSAHKKSSGRERQDGETGRSYREESKSKDGYQSRDGNCRSDGRYNDRKKDYRPHGYDGSSKGEYNNSRDHKSRRDYEERKESSFKKEAVHSTSKPDSYSANKSTEEIFDY